MPRNDGPELSSLGQQVDDVGRRIAELARAYEGTSREDLLAALLETERALRMARSHLGRAERMARG